MADHGDQLIGSLGPFGAQQSGGAGEHTHHPGVALLQMITELGHFLGDQVEGQVDHNVGGGNGGLDHGVVAPLVQDSGLVDPHDGAVSAAGSNDGGDPGDGFFVDHAVAAVQTVLVSQNQDFLTGFDTGAVVDHVGDGDHCSSGDTYVSHKNFLL